MFTLLVAGTLICAGRGPSAGGTFLHYQGWEIGSEMSRVKGIPPDPGCSSQTPVKKDPLASAPKAMWGQAEPHIARRATPPASLLTKKSDSGHVFLADITLLLAWHFLSEQNPVLLLPYLIHSSLWLLRKEDPYAHLVD